MRVKLADALAASGTGTVFRMGMGQPPYTIRVLGADSTGVSIETTYDGGDDSDVSSTATWAVDVGDVGVPGSGTDTNVKSLEGLLAGYTAVINHHVPWIRAKNNGTAVATVILEVPR